MSVIDLSRRPKRATPTELAECSVKNLGDLLNSIRDGVLVIADDIPDDQRQEIYRELALMGLMNEKASKALDLPDVPRSCHLQRENGASA